MDEPSEIDKTALHRQIADAGAQHPELAAVYLFGSFARGTQHDKSDLDLGLVFTTRGDTVRQHHRLIGDLASRLEGVARGHPLDLVVLEAQGPIFCHNALIDGELIYEGDRARRIDFESDTYVRAFDFRPTWELATKDKVAAVRRWLRSRR